MKSIIWIVVSCRSTAEAKRIGEAALTKRLIACYDVVPRLATAYFWPQKSNRIERGRGAIIILETFLHQETAVRRLVRRLHSDSLPMIGSLSLSVDNQFARWMKDQISSAT